MSGLSARPNPGRSNATARAYGETRLSRSSQSRRDPGLPCTNTIASDAPASPVDDTGTESPSIVARSPVTPAGSGPPSAWAPANGSTLRDLWPESLTAIARRIIRANSGSVGVIERDPNAQKPCAQRESVDAPANSSRSIALNGRPLA